MAGVMGAFSILIWIGGIAARRAACHNADGARVMTLVNRIGKALPKDAGKRVAFAGVALSSCSRCRELREERSCSAPWDR
jgi:hypothetical protein